MPMYIRSGEVYNSYNMYSGYLSAKFHMVRCVSYAGFGTITFSCLYSMRQIHSNCECVKCRINLILKMKQQSPTNVACWASKLLISANHYAGLDTSINHF